MWWRSIARSIPRTALPAAAIALAIAMAEPALADWPTTGGDAGREVAVTTLADSGPGSLRAAVSAGGPRRVIFAVGGEILLKKPLIVRNPYLSIAGETAPSPGISLLGDKLRIRTHDVIVRHVRVRVGELPGSDPSNRDGISIERGGDYQVGNVLIEHCSVAWAVDEGVSVWGEGISNVRIRDTIVAETLSNSIHEKGPHSMGLLVGMGTRNVVVERNLLADNMLRNPLVDAGASAVVLNNLIYNPGWAGFHVYAKPEAGPTVVSVVGNVLIAGVDSRPRNRFRSFGQGVNPGSQIYYDDNLAIGRLAFSLHERDGDTNRPVPFVDSPPIWFDWLEPIPSNTVEETVLSSVGARPDDRDRLDSRIVAEVTAGAGSIKDTPGDPRLRIPRPLAAGGGAAQ